MPRRRRAGKQRSSDLSCAQHFELLLGPGAGGEFVWIPATRRSLGTSSAFDCPGARREAWLANRDEMLEDVRAGSRPWAWWVYEGGLGPGEPQPSGWGEAAVLLAKGELARSEMAAVLAALHPGDPGDLGVSDSTRAEWVAQRALCARLRSQFGIKDLVGDALDPPV